MPGGGLISLIASCCYPHYYSETRPEITFWECVHRRNSIFYSDEEKLDEYSRRIKVQNNNNNLLKTKKQKITNIIESLIKKIPEVLIAEIMSYSGDIDFMYKNIENNDIKLEKNLTKHDPYLFAGYSFLKIEEAG